MRPPSPSDRAYPDWTTTRPARPHAPWISRVRDFWCLSVRADRTAPKLTGTVDAIPPYLLPSYRPHKLPTRKTPPAPLAHVPRGIQDFWCLSVRAGRTPPKLTGAADTIPPDLLPHYRPHKHPTRKTPPAPLTRGPPEMTPPRTPASQPLLDARARFDHIRSVCDLSPHNGGGRRVRIGRGKK